MRGKSILWDHARLCGSLDVYMIADAAGWYLVEGVELDPTAAVALTRTAGAEGVTKFKREADCTAAFRERADLPR